MKEPKQWMHYDDECMQNEWVDEQKAKRNKRAIASNEQKLIDESMDEHKELMMSLAKL